MKALTVKTPRQHRALAALLVGRVTSRELREIAGMLNAPQLIADLRALGWKIFCIRFKATDRDGKRCRPGYYEMPPDMQECASRVIRGKAAEIVVASSTADTEVPISNFDYSKQEAAWKS